MYTAIIEHWVWNGQKTNKSLIAVEKLIVGVYDTLAEACKARLDYEAKNKPNYFKVEGLY